MDLMINTVLRVVELAVDFVNVCDVVQLQAELGLCCLTDDEQCILFWLMN